MIRILATFLALLSLTGCMSVVGAIAELPLAAGKMAVKSAATVTEAAVTTTISVAGSAAGTVVTETGGVVTGIASGSSSDEASLVTVEVNPPQKSEHKSTGN